MKVVLFGTKAPGGIASVIRSYLDSELSRSYDFKYIATHIHGNVFYEILFFLFSIVISIPFLVNKDYSIFHMHISSYASIYRKMILAKIAHMFGKKVIFHAHGSQFFKDYETKSDIEKRFLRNILNSVDLLVVLSAIRMEQYSRIVEKSKIRVIHNFLPDPNFSRTFPGNPVPVAITLGAVGERKGTGLLVRAVDNLKNENFSVLIYGDGEVEKYRSLVESLGLEGKVSLPGWVSGERKMEALQEADIFILPSYNEDLPISIIEAMAYRLPIISTTAGSIREQVYDNLNGFIITPGDKNALVNAIKTLIKNPEKRRKMGEASYALFKNKFDSSLVLNKISKLYNELLNMPC